jgi:lipoprotein-anchoring transpeptidase ErfK/SrfK
MAATRQQRGRGRSGVEGTPSRRVSRGPAFVLLVVAGILAVGAGDAFAILHYFRSASPAAGQTPSRALTPPATKPETFTRAKCRIPPQPARMLTPQELADPFMVGYEIHGFGHTVECVQPGLYVSRPNAGVPNASGRVILISLDQQWLWAYQDRKLAFANPVTTGREWLWTPQGTYQITQKVADTWFYSFWPPSSPFYYAPEHVNFALYFRGKGYYIHDAPWRHAFGPGTNVPHVSPDGTYEDGSHGCVNLTTAAAKWLYNWAAIGTTVIVTN